jgi:hypothetical protein
MKRLLPFFLGALAACSSSPQRSYWRYSAPANENKTSPGEKPSPAEPVRMTVKTNESVTTPDDAARLIRESVPLYKEVADSWERGPRTRLELEMLLAKARKVERNLASAQMIYLSIPDESPTSKVVEQRTRRIDEILSAIKSTIKQIEARL